MKKSFTIVFVLVAALLLFTACPSPNDDTPSQSADMTAEQIEALLKPVTVTMAEKTWTELLKVGIISSPAGISSFNTALSNDMERVFCEANGYDAVFFYPELGSYSVSQWNNEQISAAQQFIDDGADYLLIYPSDSTGWDTVLQNAKNAGIKVLFFNVIADVNTSLYETYICNDTEKEGKIAIAWLSKQNLTQYNIIHLQGMMGVSGQKGRTAPLNDMVARNAKWNFVKQESAKWSAENAKTIVKGVIDSGKSFNVIYAENESMAKGAVETLDEAGITHGLNGDVLIVTFNCDELEEVKKGTWNCDVQENPFQAVYVHNAIVALEKGESVPKNIYVDNRCFDAATITQEDVDTYGL